MKRIISITIFLISIVNATAQYRSRGSAAEQYIRGDIELGGNIGLNISNATGNVDNEDFEPDSATSINIAATGEYYFSDRWGLKGKIIYDKKGFDEDDIDSSTNLDYISIPVLANWHFGRTRNWYLNFGLYTAFLIKSESDFEEDTEDTFKTTDIGLAFGVGVKFLLNERTKLFIEYDAQTGFSDVFDEEAFSNVDEISVKNGRSAFNIGLLFNL